MSKLNWHSFVSVCLLFLIGCGGGSLDPQKGNELKQKYYFVTYHYNAAYGTYRGFSIDVTGNIYYYQLDSLPTDPIAGLFTELNLDVIFDTNKSFLGSVSEAEFSAKKALISEATKGALGESVNICFDAGLYRYAAYEFDTDSGLYREIIVYETGDWQAINNNVAAIDLRDWMIQIALDYQIAAPYGNCTGIYEG